MRRSRDYNPVHVAIFRVVLTTIIVLIKTTESNTGDIYPKWSSVRNPANNDYRRGYSKIREIPWAAPYQSLPRGMSFERYKQATPHQIASNHHRNVDNGMTRRNLGDYSRRSANEMSLAEKEYHNVRRALALGRVQPLRRSMVPTTPGTPLITGNRNDEVTEDLLPLMSTMSSLIKRLDSTIGGVKPRRAGRTKKRVISLLKRMIDSLERKLHKKIDHSVIKSSSVSERKGDIYPPNISSTVHHRTENEIGTKLSGGGDLSMSRRTLNTLKPDKKSSSSLKVNNKLGRSVRVGEKKLITMGLDQSTVPAPRLLLRNLATKSLSEFFGKSGLVP